MVSSRLVTGALALLAASVVHAGKYRPSSTLSLSTTFETVTTSGITSTTQSSVATTETETESTTSEETSIEVTTSTVSTDTTSTGTTSTTDTVSTDTSTTETSTTDMSITTTTAQTTSDTTTFSTTTTAAAVPQCVDSNDCLLALNPLCVLGLCGCAEALCTPRPDISECMNPAQCSTGQFCQSGVCVDPVGCGSAGDCLANADVCVLPGVCSCINGLCNLGGYIP